MLLQNEREAVIRILDKYRDCPCLWKKDHPDYLNSTKKIEALDSFIDLFKCFNPEADRETVRNKLNFFKKTYDEERKKVKHYAGLYEPSLWYYNRLAFLDEDHSSPEMSQECSSSSFASASSACPTRKLGKDQFKNGVKHPFTSFADNVAEKLQSLQAPMVPVCQKLINDALYYAEMGELDSSSKIVTSKPRRRRTTDNFVVPPMNILEALEDFMRR
ncbi:uncharacterized protein LOC123320296 [Coccinella septempunctata]|uniref:uncharacterized protein LOC123320296 n=1 Tax=Coccinella septempunctata TaxID=41139 RepID=UPI001D093480|nr:uncharacterized protein LOC123320296 [Coccinella septempunctata]